MAREVDIRCSYHWVSSKKLYTASLRIFHGKTFASGEFRTLEALGKWARDWEKSKGGKIFWTGAGR